MRTVACGDPGRDGQYQPGAVCRAPRAGAEMTAGGAAEVRGGVAAEWGPDVLDARLIPAALCRWGAVMVARCVRGCRIAIAEFGVADSVGPARPTRCGARGRG